MTKLHYIIKSPTSSEQLKIIQLKFSSLQSKDLINSYVKPVLSIKYFYKYIQILFKYLKKKIINSIV